MALTNAVLTFLLAIAVCALSSVARVTASVESAEQPSTFRLVSARSLPLMPADGEHSGRWRLVLPGLLTGVDGPSAILLCVFCGLMLAASLAAARESHTQPVLLFGLLLLWQSLMMLSLVSLDLRLTTAATALSLPVLFLLAGLWGGPQRRQSVVWLIAVAGCGAAVEFAAALLLLEATVPLLGEVAHPVRVSSALLPERLHVLLQSSDSLAQWWSRVGNWVFPLIVVGTVLRLLLFPLHNLWLAIFRQLPRFLQIVLPGALLAGGLQFLLRLLPLCGDCGALAPRGLVWFGLCSSGWMVVRAGGTHSASDRLALMVPAGGGLALAAICLPAEGGLTAAALLVATVALAIGAAAASQEVMSPVDNSRPGPARTRAVTVFARHGLHPVTVPLWLAGLAVALPLAASGSSGGSELLNPRQPGIWLLLVWACIVRHLAIVLWMAMALPELSRKADDSIEQVGPLAARSASSGDVVPRASHPAARYQLAIALPPLLLLAVLALAPAAVTDFLQPAASRFYQLTLLVHQVPD